MRPDIKPIKIYRPFNGIEIKLFGKPDDWNLSRHKFGSVVLNRVANITEMSGVKNILAPRPSMFNAKICDSKDLIERLEIGRGIKLFRGCDADGVPLKKGEAFWLSSADCPTIIVTDIKSGKTIAAHGGRNSLMDSVKITTGKKSRKNESVIDSIMSRMKGVNKSDIRAFIVSGVRPENFKHRYSDKNRGVYNKLMVEYVIDKWGRRCVVGEPKDGRISLVEIIKSQFVGYGVKRSQIKSTPIHTYEDRDKKGNYVWWSNRRGDKLKRNGVLVIKH